MKILFFGDIVSFVGREGVKKIIQELRKNFTPDIILANGENVSHGSGISITHFNELNLAGIDLFTGGNHIWKRKDTIELFNAEFPKVIRPLNYPKGLHGVGYRVLTLGNEVLIVLNLQGRVFMNENLNCPFISFDEFFKEISQIKYDSILVDFHTETTSEKVAFGNYVDGRANIVLGTHTHIQTADNRILPNGTAYITDVGGCYAIDSVIGVSKDIAISRFLTQMNEPFTFPESGECIVNAVFIEIIKQKIIKFERISNLVTIDLLCDKVRSEIK